MKNIKLMLLPLCAVLSTSLLALVQPLNPVSEDSPVRISLGAKGAFGANHQDKFGTSDVGGGIGFTHNPGWDFQYGLAVGYDYTSYMGRIFTQNSKATEGSRLDVDLVLRYMPELAERFNLGLNVVVGWGHYFGANAQALNDSMKFGDLKFKVGPAMSLALSSSVSTYLAANYSLHDIRFGVKEKSDASRTANWQGADIVLGFQFAVSDKASLFVQSDSRFTNIAKGARFFKEEVTLGMSFEI